MTFLIIIFNIRKTHDKNLLFTIFELNNYFLFRDIPANPSQLTVFSIDFVILVYKASTVKWTGQIISCIRQREMSPTDRVRVEGYGRSILIGIVVLMYATVGILFIWFISNPENIEKMKKRRWVSRKAKKSKLSDSCERLDRTSIDEFKKCDRLTDLVTLVISFATKKMAESKFNSWTHLREQRKLQREMRRAKHQAGETSRQIVEDSSFQTVQNNTTFEGASKEEISQYLQEPKPNCEKKTD